MSELIACPFCGKALSEFGHDKRNGVVVTLYIHPTPEEPIWNQCPLSGLVFDSQRWNTRPIEDGLRAELAAAQAEGERLRNLLEQRVMGNWEDGAQ